MTKKKLFILALITLLAFPAISWLIAEFLLNRSLLFVFNSPYTWWLQTIIGGAFGWIAAIAGWRLLQTPFLKEKSNKYLNLFAADALTVPLIFFISISAGIGEELFFRGILQPYLGIFITSVLFVAIHGYLNPKDWQLSIYGLFLVIVIVIIGILCEKLGMFAAISAHTIFDFVLLLKIKSVLSDSTQQNNYYS